MKTKPRQIFCRVFWRRCAILRYFIIKNLILNFIVKSNYSSNFAGMHLTSHRLHPPRVMLTTPPG